MTLLFAAVALVGNWRRMLPYAADQVMEFVRPACPDGVHLLCDRQPTRLLVGEHTAGLPAVWLHPMPAAQLGSSSTSVTELGRSLLIG